LDAVVKHDASHLGPRQRPVDRPRRGRHGDWECNPLSRASRRANGL